MRVIYTVLLAMPLACLLVVNAMKQPAPQPAPQQRPPQQRRQFMKEGVVEHSAGSGRVLANSPRPLVQAISALNEEYGWVVDYEDPPYVSDAELVDDTDPQWRANNPGAPGVTIVAGGPFQLEYDEGPEITGHEGREAVLRKVVAAYNRSGNPGKFTLRAEGEGRYSVVGTSVKNQSRQDQNVSPILDTPISLPAQQRNGEDTVKAILTQLSAKTGVKMGIGSYSMNVLVQTQVTVGGENVPARSLLLKTFDATKRPLIWSLLYDADSKIYFLNISVASRATRDTYGRKRLVPIDLPVGPRAAQ